MKLAVMQPYFVPYIGYFQLINAVDMFVIFDDVNYMNRGWVNRNRILLNGQPHYVTLCLSAASQCKKINDLVLKFDSRKMLKTIYHSYCKAKYFSSVQPLVERILTYEEENLAKYITNSIREVAEYLGIKGKLINASVEHIRQDLKGRDRIITMCKHYGAAQYYNAIGGMSLYNKEEFKAEGIDLKFLKTKDFSYKQFGNDFVPSLSIIDVLMFNSRDEVINLLDQYELV